MVSLVNLEELLHDFDFVVYLNNDQIFEIQPSLGYLTFSVTVGKNID